MIGDLAYLAARAFRRIAGVIEKLGGTQKIAVQRAMAAYDMTSQPSEDYYRRQYWHWLLPELEERFPNRQARALDVGCGHGRLALPTAQWLQSGTLIGVDVTGAAIDQARAYSSQLGLSNVEFHEADALDFVGSLPNESIDLALMLEVSFFMPAYKEVIKEIGKVLKKGGLLFVSFRSQYFDLLHSIQAHDWQSAQLVRETREGHWGGGSTWFSWHTVEDIEELLSAAGFSVEKYRGIGIASGIEGDPLSLIVQPSSLSSAEQSYLLELETSLAERYAQCGRYILAVAVKTA